MNKFLCTIETKNYAVRNITPMMQPYARMDRHVTKPEILACLDAGAIVTLHKTNAGLVRLTRENITRELTAVTNVVQSVEIKEVKKEIKAENKTHIEELKKQIEEAKPAETPVVTSVPTNTSKKKSSYKAPAPTAEKKEEPVKETVDEKTTETTNEVVTDKKETETK